MKKNLHSMALVVIWSLILVNIFYVFSKVGVSNNVNVFPIAEYIKNGGEHREIDNFRAPFKLLMGEGSNQMYHFEFNLPIGSSEKRSVWIYAGKAMNHGIAKVQIDGDRIGNVDLTLDHITSGPSYELEKISNYQFKQGSNKVELDIFPKNQGFFYAELGAIILAPPEINKSELEKRLSTQQDGIDPILYGFLLVLLLMSMRFIKNFKPSLQKVNNYCVVLLGLTLFYTACIWQENIYLTRIESKNSVSEIHKSLSAYKDAIFKKSDGKSEVVIAKAEIPQPNNFELDVLNVENVNIASNKPITENLIWGLIHYSKAGCAKDNLKCIPRDQLITLLFVFYFIGLVFSFAKYLPRNSAFLGLFPLPLLSFASLALSSGWDELFVNLRHGLNLANSSIFSINALSPIEATVDTLPLALCGLLIKIFGVNPINSIILVSLLGIFFIFVAAQSISRQYLNPTISYLISSLVAATPCVLWVSGSGFFSPLFTGFLLLSFSYYVLFEKRWLGILLLILCFMVRTEGFLFGVLLLFFELIYLCYLEKNWAKSIFKRFGYIFVYVASFGIYTILRFYYYGEALPIPMIFKNTGIDPGYINVGIGRLIDSASFNLITILFLNFSIIYIVFYKFIDKNIKFKLLFVYQIVFIVFTLPYFIGGGDWFNIYWNRYAMPVTVYFMLCNLIGIYLIFIECSRNINLRNLIVSLGMVSILISFIKYSNENISSSYSTLYRSLKDPDKQSWDRINSLASLGRFINERTGEKVILGSTEEATIMYFAQREMVGMLGVSNPKIAKLKLDPMDAGDILHRKRAIKSLEEDRPDILLLFEPVFKIDSAVKDNPEELKNFLQNKFFNPWMNNITTYRYGGIKKIIDLGYTPISIINGEYVYIIFINDNLKDGFNMRGIKYLARFSVDFPVDPKVFSKFMGM